MTQHEKIINLLDDGNWHCTNEMYAMYMADPRSRISKLIKDGYPLIFRWCEQHDHKKSKEWKLTKQPIQTNLL